MVAFSAPPPPRLSQVPTACLKDPSGFWIPEFSMSLTSISALAEPSWRSGLSISPPRIGRCMGSSPADLGNEISSVICLRAHPCLPDQVGNSRRCH